jgi:hypothetical protein
VRRLVNHLAIASLIGLAIGAAVTVPAGASTGGAQFRIVGVHSVTSQVTQSKSQNSNIVGNTKKAIFSPNALTVLEDTSGGDCAESKPPVDFTITNTGSKTEYVTFRGSPNFSIKKGKVEDICIYGVGAGGQVQFGLTNKKDTKTYAAILTVTLSD